MAFGGNFLYLSVSEARFVIDHINGHTPCIIKNLDELLKEEKESTPKQEEEVSITKVHCNLMTWLSIPKHQYSKLLQVKKKFYP